MKMYAVYTAGELKFLAQDMISAVQMYQAAITDGIINISACLVIKCVRVNVEE